MAGAELQPIEHCKIAIDQMKLIYKEVVKGVITSPVVCTSRRASGRKGGQPAEPAELPKGVPGPSTSGPAKRQTRAAKAAAGSAEGLQLAVMPVAVNKESEEAARKGLPTVLPFQGLPTCHSSGELNLGMWIGGGIHATGRILMMMCSDGCAQDGKAGQEILGSHRISTWPRCR